MSTSALKSINDLLAYEYEIPSFQRGYRWKKKQVEQLLDDIWEFDKKEKKKTEYYCLQPIVVVPISEKSYSVIDGQQRLTTILIILSTLKDAVKLLYPSKSLYKINYTTRERSGEYLLNIEEDRHEENIDFHHMYYAKQTVIEWLEKNEEARGGLIKSFLGEDTPNVQVIWYELGNQENPKDVFTRLNMGKIQLTNAELIKALFLGNLETVEEDGAISAKQREIAVEWDRYENELQTEEFWYFLQNGVVPYTNRIEFLFDLVAENISSSGKRINDDKDYTFRFFAERIKTEGVVVLWQKVKDLFQKLFDWYTDKTLFHLIGYLITSGESIQQLSLDLKHKSKSECNQLIKSKIRASIPTEDIASLSYFNSKKELRNVLLLFNVLSILENEKTNYRFQFGRYKDENWDIEHIHSVQSEKPNSDAHKMDWIKEVERFTNDDHLKARLKKYIELRKADRNETFDTLYEFVLEKYSVPNKESDDLLDSNDINDISNLALLDSGTNRGYKNAIFPIKRNKIIERDQTGTFVPLCTKNVFLKYYNRQVNQNSLWGIEDRESYKNSLEKCINNYFDEQ